MNVSAATASTACAATQPAEARATRATSRGRWGSARRWRWAAWGLRAVRRSCVTAAPIARRAVRLTCSAPARPTARAARACRGKSPARSAPRRANAPAGSAPTASAATRAATGRATRATLPGQSGPARCCQLVPRERPPARRTCAPALLPAPPRAPMTRAARTSPSVPRACAAGREMGGLASCISTASAAGATRRAAESWCCWHSLRCCAPSPARPKPADLVGRV